MLMQKISATIYRYRLLLLLASLLVTALAAAACGTATSSPTGASTGGKRLKVVTTVAPITNIVQNVGGTRIDLKGVVSDGADSHTFEPAPSDARTLADADLILINGLHLEEPTRKLAEANKKSATPIYQLGDNTITEREWVFDFSFPKEAGDPNPHLWMNVAYSKHYAELARDQLVKLDPANQSYYEENTRKFGAQMDKLDAAIRQAVQTVPAQNRKLVTYHDSFAYFAPRYGMTVVGAIQPSDFKEPSAREVAAMIEQLKKEMVPAIFGSEVFPSTILNQIGSEAKVRFVDTLSDDELPGQPGESGHTYAGMMVKNVTTLVEALGGKADALKDVDVKNTYGP